MYCFEFGIYTNTLYVLIVMFVQLRLWLPQVLADAVSRLVVEKFSELTDNFTSPHARRKVLAGVVMTTGRVLHRN